MKNLITIFFLVFALCAQAQTCRVLERTPGSITFVVDENLPAPTVRLSNSTLNKSAEKLVREFREEGKENILAQSFADSTLNVYGRSPFFNMMVNAYADHHGVELSPDVVWLLISQAFSHHIAKDPEKYRSLLVDHEGKKTLSVQDNKALRSEKTDWNGIVDNLAQQVSDNTKGDIANTITADFSTTGSIERMASQITLMDAVRWYFDYEVILCVCGIPQITLKGTPEDWTHLREKAKRLSQYGLKWWIDDLVPVLKEFEKAAGGKPNRKFWQNIVCKVRPDMVRGASCGKRTKHSGPTQFDGWFLKLLPFDTKGHTPKTVNMYHEFIPETVQVPFMYKELYLDREVTTPMELWAGLVGFDENPDSKVLSMKIGWLVRDASEDPQVQENGTADDYEYGIIDITVDEVPSWLKDMGSIKHLELHFNGNVEIPSWMDNIRIGTFRIHGNLTPAEQQALKSHFKNLEIVAPE